MLAGGRRSLDPLFSGSEQVAVEGDKEERYGAGKSM